MYGVLMANTLGCVAFSLPVQRWNLTFLSFQRFSTLLEAPARAARPKRGARVALGPEALRSRTGFEQRPTPISDPGRDPQVISGERDYAPKELGLRLAFTWPSAKETRWRLPAADMFRRADA